VLQAPGQGMNVYEKKDVRKSMLELDNIKYEMGTVDGSLKELGESLCRCGA
jgi:hypothetical protein